VNSVVLVAMVAACRLAAIKLPLVAVKLPLRADAVVKLLP
jgi:hypothetical protein